MQPAIDFVRASRERILDQLPVKDRVARLLCAVDRCALAAIAAGAPDAFCDDGQVLCARIPTADLQQAMGASADTVRRSVRDARETPFLDVDEEPGRAGVFWLHWPEIVRAQPDLRGVVRESAGGRTEKCEGSHPNVRGVAPECARGRTSKTAEKPDPWQDPPQIPRDREEEIKLLRGIRELRDREHGGCGVEELCEGSHPQAAAGAAVAAIALESGDAVPGFFAPELSDLLPWQRLEPAHLVTLDLRVLCVLYAEAVSRGWWRDTHDARRRFLAVAFHCARHRRIAPGDRVRFFVGRVRNRNTQGLMDRAWTWSAEQLDAAARGGAMLTAAVQACARRDALAVQRRDVTTCSLSGDQR